jgi:hypothetical protein
MQRKQSRFISSKTNILPKTIKNTPIYIIRIQTTHLELEVAPPDVQRVVLAAELRRHRPRLLAHRLHQLVPVALDLVFVPHVVSNKPVVAYTR